MSQIDRSKPQRQRIIHRRESSSMPLAQLAGRMAVKNL
jgi:hypothetical protein